MIRRGTKLIRIADYISGDRLKHSLAVKKKVKKIISKHPFSKEQKDIIVRCAELHDIGYSTNLNKTGFHPLDGYMYLNGRIYDSIARACLMHTSAHQLVYYINKDIRENFELELNNIQLTEFDKICIELVTIGDILTDGKGNNVTIEERYKDILKRHGDNYISKVFCDNINYYEMLDKKWRNTYE